MFESGFSKCFFLMMSLSFFFFATDGAGLFSREQFTSLQKFIYKFNISQKLKKYFTR